MRDIDMNSIKHRILCADYNKDTSDMLSIFLSLLDYEVVISRNIKDALRVAQCEDFDIYLLDTWYPDGSGIDLCKRIREFDPLTPIVFYSADAFEVDRQRALRAGAQAYLTRPDSISDLITVIDQLITTTIAAGSHISTYPQRVQHTVSR
jgi:DNA-binding response OmpR family regulator